MIAHDFGAISPTTRCRKVTTPEGEDQGDHVAGRVRQAHRVQQRAEQVLDRRLGQRAEAQGAQRDAELRAGQHQRQLADAVQRGPGRPAAAGRRLLQPVPLAGHQGELGGHEEPVQRQQDHRD